MASAPLPSAGSNTPENSPTGSAGGAGAFNPKVVLGLLLFGAAAFLATLYFIGSGNTGRDANNGQAHAAANGLVGYAALVNLLESDGHEVSISRSVGNLKDEGLLVITPPRFADAEEITKIIEERRYIGPTLVILPKWYSSGIPEFADVEHEDGWVMLGNIGAPDFVEEFEGNLQMLLKTGELRQTDVHWSGLGLTGKLPDHKQVMGFEEEHLIPLIADADGDMLAGYLDDGGSYPVLDDATGNASPTRPLDEDDDEYYDDADQWNVTFVAEPDLFNNYGMADQTRAILAHELIDTVMEGEDLPITFDVTLNGLGQSQNLLTLAFTPPFLAATLCLILALIVVAWRAFRRFGPAMAEQRAIAFGKQRLVANSAGLIQRSGRLHLLTDPYADMIEARLAAKLGLRHPETEAIDAALARRLPDERSFSDLSAWLRSARRPGEILRAAHALKSIERKL